MIDGKGCFKHEMLHGFTHINNYILKQWQNLVIVDGADKNGKNGIF